MKHLNILTISAFCFTLMLCSCNDDAAKNCGDEKASAFPTMDATVFTNHYSPEILTYTTYFAYYYENIGGYSRFVLSTGLKKVCSSEPVIINAMLELLVANSDIKDTIRVTSLNNSFTQSVLPSGTLYSAVEAFDTKGTGTTDVALEYNVYVPYQGSRSADSLYFWGQVVNWRLNSEFKISE